MKVALYLRVSTAEQTRGHSLDSQRSLLTDWAKREGWEIVEEYEDPGVTGTTARKRPAFLRMIDDAEYQQFEAVLVLRLDRFARNRIEAPVYREQLASAGVKLLSLQEPTPDGPAGFLMEGMHELLAAYYSVEMAHKIRLGLRKKAEKGGALGTPPIGYARVDGELTPNADAAHVKAAFEAYADGASVIEIARELTRLGVHAPRQDSRAVSQAVVRNLLSNLTYCGDVTHHREVVVTDAHPPIVSRELFDIVQQLRRMATRRSRGLPSLLSVIATCAHCGSPMWAATATSRGGRSYHYYRCAWGRTTHGADECAVGRRGVRRSEVDDMVHETMPQLVMTDEWAQRVLSNEGKRTLHIEDERTRLVRRRDRIRRMVADEMLGYEDGRKELLDIEQRLAELAAPKPVAVRATKLGGIAEAWHRMNLRQQRSALDILMETVTIDLMTADPAQKLKLVPRHGFEAFFYTAAQQLDSPIRLVQESPSS